MRKKIGWETKLCPAACCALRHAFIKNPEAVKRQTEIHGVQRVWVLTEVLENSAGLTVSPKDISICGAVADAEIRRLTDENVPPPEHCRKQFYGFPEFVHTNEEHRDALRIFLSMTRPRFAGVA